MYMIIYYDFVCCLNVLVVVNKGTWAVKLCSNKLFQFLTGDAG